MEDRKDGGWQMVMLKVDFSTVADKSWGGFLNGAWWCRCWV